MTKRIQLSILWTIAELIVWRNCQHVGLQHSTAGNAALIIALSPIATTFLARIFLKEHLTITKLRGATLALTRVGTIVLYGGGKIGISRLRSP